MSIAQSGSQQRGRLRNRPRDGPPAGQRSPEQRVPVAEDGADRDNELMDGSASLTPGQRIAAECARRGDAAFIAGCVALLGGRADDVDDSLITVLGGDAARHVLDGGEGGRAGDWPRVWAARGLLHAWNERRAAEADAATDAIIGATRDPAWRVREMAAKVVARHHVGEALEAVAALRDDPVPGSGRPPSAPSSRSPPAGPRQPAPAATSRRSRRRRAGSPGTSSRSCRSSPRRPPRSWSRTRS